MATQRKLMTADEFSCLPDDGMRHELVRGEVTTSPPPGPGHGEPVLEIAFVLGGFIREHRLGHMYASETGFWIESDPDTVRAPDFAFVSFDRLPGRSPDRYAEGLIPDLVVEVVSPSQSAREVREKMENWIRTGVRLGILARPRNRSIDVYTPSSETRTLTADDVLEGGDVLPGFTCQSATCSQSKLPPGRQLARTPPLPVLPLRFATAPSVRRFAMAQAPARVARRLPHWGEVEERWPTLSELAMSRFSLLDVGDWTLANFFPSVAPEVWDVYRAIYPDALSDPGSICTSATSYAVRSRELTILVDTGLGPGPHERIGDQTGQLLIELRSQGIAPEDVSLVVHTHLHADHVGWNGLFFGDDVGRPFPGPAIWRRKRTGTTLASQRRWNDGRTCGERSRCLTKGSSTLCRASIQSVRR